MIGLSRNAMGTYLNHAAHRTILPTVCSYLTTSDPEIIGLLAFAGQKPDRGGAELNARTLGTHCAKSMRKLNLPTPEELLQFAISRQTSLYPFDLHYFDGTE